MARGHGFADYLLFVHGKAVGVLEAKPAGYLLINVELLLRSALAQIEDVLGDLEQRVGTEAVEETV